MNSLVIEIYYPKVWGSIGKAVTFIENKADKNRSVLLMKRLESITELSLLRCIYLTAGVKLLTPSGHRQIRDVITTGIEMWWRRMRKGGGEGMDHTSVAALTNQLCSDRGVVRVFEYSINVLYYKYGRNQS